MSSVPHRNTLPDPPVERCAAFTGGHPFVHEDGTVVRFSDDSWVLSLKPPSRIGFHGISAWLLPYAKLVVAENWLQHNASMSNLIHYPTSYRAVGNLLPSSFSLSSIEQLSISHVEELEGALERAYRTGRKAGSLAPIVHAANKAIRAAVLKGANVRVEFRLPKIVARALVERNRGVGRANPKKVLSEEVHVALIRAADLDLLAYDQARREIDRAF